MYSITKTFTFCYGHRLYKDSGRCANLHGHTAKVEVTLETKTLNKQEMAHDFRDLKKTVGEWLKANWDHKTILNKEDPLCNALKDAGEKCFEFDGNPTVEKLAEYLFNAIGLLSISVKEVKIWESESSCATYEK